MAESGLESCGEWGGGEMESAYGKRQEACGKREGWLGKREGNCWGAGSGTLGGNVLRKRREEYAKIRKMSN